MGLKRLQLFRRAPDRLGASFATAAFVRGFLVLHLPIALKLVRQWWVAKTTTSS